VNNEDMFSRYQLIAVRDGGDVVVTLRIPREDAVMIPPFVVGMLSLPETKGAPESFKDWIAKAAATITTATLSDPKPETGEK